MTDYHYIVHIPVMFDRLNDANIIPDRFDTIGEFTDSNQAQICMTAIREFAYITGWSGHIVLSMTDGTTYQVMDYYPVNQYTD